MKAKPLNKTVYYEMKEHLNGIPLHVARRFLRKYIKGPIPIVALHPMISMVMRNTFLADKDKHARWKQQFEVSLCLMVASNAEKKDVFARFLDSMEVELMNFQSNLHFSLKKIEHIEVAKIEFREKVSALMAVYKDLYDGYYKCICSTISISKLILNQKDLPADFLVYIHEDPKIKIRELECDDKDGCVLPLPELCVGCNRHLRNSIAHQRWKLSGNIIECWDSLNGKRTWEKKFTFESLFQEVKSLLSTVEAMSLALVVFKCITDKNVTGLFAFAPGDYELPFIDEAVGSTAYALGLFLNSSEVDEKQNEILLDIYVLETYAFEQVTRIIEGSNPPRGFKIPICVLKNSLSDMILNLLLVAGGPLIKFNKVHMYITDEKLGKLGEFDIPKEELERFLHGNKKDLEARFVSLAGHAVTTSVEGQYVPDYGDDAELDKKLLASAKARLGIRSVL